MSYKNLLLSLTIALPLGACSWLDNHQVALDSDVVEITEINTYVTPNSEKETYISVAMTTESWDSRYVLTEASQAPRSTVSFKVDSTDGFVRGQRVPVKYKCIAFDRITDTRWLTRCTWKLDGVTTMIQSDLSMCYIKHPLAYNCEEFVAGTEAELRYTPIEDPPENCFKIINGTIMDTC